mgnify:CR=1 FL=1
MKRKINIKYWLLFSIILIIVKVTGLINISWWWILLPLWLPASFSVLVLTIIVMTTFKIAK